MDAGIIYGGLGLLATYIGGLAGLWFRLTGTIREERDANARQDTDIKVLEVDLKNLKEGVGKDVKELKGQVEKLSEALQKHMDEEPGQIKDALRAVLAERSG